MEPIKSVTITPTQAGKARKARPAGHPPATTDSRVGGTVGPAPRRGRALPAAEPLYHVGQRVVLLGGGNRWARTHSSCRVLAVLPYENGPFQYRVRSEVESYERVVAEADLAPAE